MKSPAVLWYPSDFMSSTSFWTNEQCGAYIKLLNFQFILGHLKIEQIKTITNDEEVLKKFIKDKKGLYYNERMDLEITKRSKYSDSRSKNKLGKTKEDKKIISKSYDNHMGNGNININNSIYYTNKELNNIFIEYLILRKKLKAINSERAIKSLIEKLSKYEDSIKYKMIEESIVHSWKDVYELKAQQNNQNTPLPQWLGKEIKKEDMTKEEEEELKNCLKEFE